ncbi:uncharacterized protein LOC21387396 [Morus notabilis]|uniref:uncharacterized protein LOC21387396 n=1 Tax=Morus notabilis TaxID=981085 RepID=UPI000CED6A80|nr:uncharacterized protein LOC21387396 [Morus notabilis]
MNFIKYESSQYQITTTSNQRQQVQSYCFGPSGGWGRPQPNFNGIGKIPTPVIVVPFPICPPALPPPSRKRSPKPHRGHRRNGSFSFLGIGVGVRHGSSGGMVYDRTKKEENNRFPNGTFNPSGMTFRTNGEPFCNKSLDAGETENFQSRRGLHDEYSEDSDDDDSDDGDYSDGSDSTDSDEDVGWRRPMY